MCAAQAGFSGWASRFSRVLKKGPHTISFSRRGRFRSRATLILGVRQVRILGESTPDTRVARFSRPCFSTLLGFRCGRFGAQCEFEFGEDLWTDLSRGGGQ